MKSVSNHSFRIIGLALCVFLWGALAAQAQGNREKYVISAEAGGINHVSGNVTVRREGMTDELDLTSADDLRSGDRVITGFGGRVEVLLNPGSYLRVGADSEFEMTDTSLDNLLVTLTRGSAVIEVVGADGVKMEIKVKTPQTEILITKGGLYRFNVLSGDLTELIVRKGRALFGAGAINEVKSGQKVLIGRGAPQFAKMNKKEMDELDLWSEDRAEMLASANRKLRRRDLAVALNDFGWNDYNNSNSLGTWVYNARARVYCFLPDGSRVYVSPYGHQYGSCGGCPPGTSNRPPTPPTGGTQPIATGGGSGNGGGGGSGGGNDGGGGNSGGGGNNNPTPSAPVSQPSAPMSQPIYQPPPPSSSPPAERSTPSRGLEQNPN